MFEKEAERSFEELDDRGIGDDWSIEEAYENGFSNGAEFGYCKANEWHNLRKNPDDLPNELEIVLCYCLGYCGVSYPITARMYIDYEDSSVHRWWTIAGEGHSEQLTNVIAWKEIVPPKVNQ